MRACGLRRFLTSVLYSVRLLRCIFWAFHFRVWIRQVPSVLGRAVNIFDFCDEFMRVCAASYAIYIYAWCAGMLGA